MSPADYPSAYLHRRTRWLGRTSRGLRGVLATTRKIARAIHLPIRPALRGEAINRGAHELIARAERA